MMMKLLQLISIHLFLSSFVQEVQSLSTFQNNDNKISTIIPKNNNNNNKNNNNNNNNGSNIKSFFSKNVSSSNGSFVDRRNVMKEGILATTTGLFFVSTTAMTSSPAQAASSASSSFGAEAFVGTYSDPINHPGGKRTIELLSSSIVGDYQLAQVIGGGGRGEPQNYILPAVILGDRTIIIDFSPKGGPRDFVGVLDKKNGNIQFTRDGNVWPRLSSTN